MTRKIAVSVLTLTAALLIMSMPARAANTTNVTTPISGLFSDSCSGDILSFTGTVHDVMNTTVNGNTVHFVLHANIHITATGSPSGASYVGDQSLNETENLILTSPQVEFNVTNLLTAISQGSAPNLLFLQTQHLTVNANGGVTVNRIDISSACH